MADVATLGLEVRSDQVEKGAKSLDNLTNSAKRAEAAAEGVSAATRNAGSAAASLAAETGQAAASLNKETIAAQRAASAMRASNDNARRMGGSMSGLAAQFQDIGVTAAAGMSPAIIGLQQGAQIAGQMEMAMASGASAVSVLGTALKSLLSPVTFISIVLTTLAAALLQMVNWGKAAGAAVRSLASVLQTIAPYAAMAAAGLALMYAPAIVGGLVTVATSVGSVATAVRAVAIAIYAVVGLPALLVAGFVAMVAAANVFRDELTGILGVDIVGAAKTGVNYIIGSFVAAFHDIQFIWNQLPNIVGAAAIGAANATISAIEKMINAASEMLNGLIRSLNAGLAKLPGGVSLGEIGKVDFGRIDNPYASSLGKANAAHAGQVQSDLSRDYLGEFGSGIAKGASAATDKLKDLAKWLETVDEKKKKKKGGKTHAEKYDDIIDGANRRIASLQAEYDALGMTEMAAAKLAYETEMLNQAQQKGITLSAAQKAEISSLADRMATLEIATKNAREAMDFAKDLTKGFIGDLRSGLEQGKSFWESFGNAALNVLDKITDKLLDDVLTAIFKVNSAGTGGGGFWGSLLSAFGLGGGGSGFAGAASVVASGGFSGFYANGTASARAGYAIVGEKGPEIVKFGGGEQVIPNHRIVAANDRAANQNIIQIIDQRSGGTIEREDRDGVTRLIVRDEIKKSGLGTVQQHAALHREAISQRYIK